MLGEIHREPDVPRKSYLASLDVRGGPEKERRGMGVVAKGKSKKRSRAYVKQQSHILRGPLGHKHSHIVITVFCLFSLTAL